MTHCRDDAIVKPRSIKEWPAMRGRNKGRGSRHGFSVFVDNLPQNLDRYGLKGIFRKAGRVIDSYIPAKQVRTLWR